jgi:Protein of unknown function (DUF2845)
MCALLAMVTVPTIGSSDDLIRCGSGIVSTGMSGAELIVRCGQPSYQSVSTQDLRDEYGTKVGTLTTEIWRYDGHSTAPAMTVTVVDGEVQGIERRK